MRNFLTELKQHFERNVLFWKVFIYVELVMHSRGFHRFGFISDILKLTRGSNDQEFYQEMSSKLRPFVQRAFEEMDAEIGDYLTARAMNETYIGQWCAVNAEGDIPMCVIKHEGEA